MKPRTQIDSENLILEIKDVESAINNELEEIKKQNSFKLSCKNIGILLLSFGPAICSVTLYHSLYHSSDLWFDGDGGLLGALLGSFALPFVTAAHIANEMNPNKNPISSLVDSLEKTQILLNKLKHFDGFSSIDLSSPIHKFLKKTSLLTEHLNSKILKEKKFQYKLQEYGLFTPNTNSSNINKTTISPNLILKN